MVCSVSVPVPTPEPLYRHETEGRVTIQGEGVGAGLIQSKPCYNLFITTRLQNYNNNNNIGPNAFKYSMFALLKTGPGRPTIFRVG